MLLSCPICDKRLKEKDIWIHLSRMHSIQSAKNLPSGVFCCERCGAPLREDQQAAHLELYHGQGNPLDWEECLRCYQIIRKSALNEHIKKVHNDPPKESAASRANSNRLRNKDQQQKWEDQELERLAVRRREDAIQIEPFECGWCYQPIYQVLQKNGYNSYYDDRQLKYKHNCTRPAHWDPDKG